CPGRDTQRPWQWAQSCETRLRQPNSLLTGKETGNFHFCGLLAKNCPEKRTRFQSVTTEFPKNRNRECARARTAGPQSLRPSHRDANATLGAGVDGEVLGRTGARTLKPIAAPFRRRYPDRAPQAD